MLRETIEINFKRLLDFLIYSRNFLIRRNPFKSLSDAIVNGFKDFLTMKKKLKMAQYRLNYHRHQFQKMENLIAQNNQHTFLKGKNLNETR